MLRYVVYFEVQLDLEEIWKATGPASLNSVIHVHRSGHWAKTTAI